MPVDYLRALRDEIVIITPTARIAGLISNHYHRAMHVAEQQCWKAPPVLPLAAWLAEVFRDCQLLGCLPQRADFLLSSDQERVVWEQILDESGKVDYHQTARLARLATQAHSQFLWWEFSRAALEQTAAGEARSFLRWLTAFESRCDAIGALDQHRFLAQLLSISDPQRRRLGRFQFYGFAPLPPLMRRLCASQTNLLGERAPIPETAQTPAECLTFTDPESEMRAAVTWASHTRASHPGATVAIAFAAPNWREPAFEQQLKREFANAASGRLHCAYPDTETALSAPLIVAAMRLLDRQDVRSWDQISELIMSPYIAGARTERSQRALLDERLRQVGDVDVSLDTTIRAARNLGEPCPQLATQLEQINAAGIRAAAVRSLDEWLGEVDAVLRIAGWPGDFDLNESEQLAYTAWQRALDSVAALGVVLPALSWHAALGELRAILAWLPLASRAPLAAIEIMSIAEASIVLPEHIWVADIHDRSWPPAAELNPLLPVDLQRKLGVPGSDPRTDLMQARQALWRIDDGALQSTWSFARSDKDGPRRPFGGATCHAAELSAALAWPRAQDYGFDIVSDEYAQPLAPGTTLRGGTQLFTDQALCPFRAVARHRLDARSLEDPQSGLSARERGSLVHRVMADCWRQLRTHASLCALSDAERDAKLATHVDTALREYRRHRALGRRMWKLERERLIALCSEWFDEEIKRAPFDVLACELEHRAALDSYVLLTRIDRIDRLANGKHLVIDYKTGDASRASWLSPRLDQPQLPLYALTVATDDVTGIAYARIKRGQCRYVDSPAGIVGESDEDVAHAEFVEQRTQWQEDLDNLLEEISTGLAVSTPKRGAASCRYCDLHAVCRIYEQRAEPSSA